LRGVLFDFIYRVRHEMKCVNEKRSLQALPALCPEPFEMLRSTPAGASRGASSVE
jgi:hypothetical protein